MVTGISLHIGVNEVDPKHYSGWSGPLKSCEADAEDLRALASEQNFNTALLATKRATCDSVRNAIHEAASSLKEGDIFFLSYSGHGGQVADVSGDEADLRDETWCLYDGQLLDDELYLLWSRFQPGVRILVLSDSCHSGTVLRAPLSMAVAETDSMSDRFTAEQFGIEEHRYRCMPNEAAARTYRSNKKHYDEIQAKLPDGEPEIRATVRLISGCQDNQLSIDGTFNGLFTGQLLRIWSSGSFGGNYASFHNQIVARMPPTQTPNHLVFGASNPDFDRQQPFTI